jgi:murein tripeptide amidase MpaA
MTTESKPDDVMHVAISAHSVHALQRVARAHKLDLGCSPHLRSVTGGHQELHAHVRSSALPGLRAEPGVSVRLLRNASEDGAAAQRRVVTRASLPAGHTRFRGIATAAPQHPHAITAYLSVDVVDQQIQALAAELPALCQLITLPHKTPEGRTVHALHVGKQGAKKTKTVLFTACAHAREWGGAEICLNFVTDLLDGYTAGTGVTYGNKSFAATDLVTIVETMDVFVVPCINPDGRHYSQTSEALWRKNRNTAYSGGDPKRIGVDLNRNYDFLWDFEAAFAPSVIDGTEPGCFGAPASADTSDDVYHGPSALSEPECQNVVWLLDQHPEIGWLLDIHSYGPDLLYSWGDSADQNGQPAMSFLNKEFDGKRGVTDASKYGEWIAAGDQRVVSAATRAAVDAINAVRGQAYQPRQDFFLAPTGGATATYPTSGCVDDYSYSRQFAAKKPPIHGFTLEFSTDSFHPPFPEMGNVIEDVDAGLFAFCLFEAP